MQACVGTARSGGLGEPWRWKSLRPWEILTSCFTLSELSVKGRYMWTKWSVKLTAYLSRDPPTETKILRVIWALGHLKAPDSDGLTPFVFKGGGMKPVRQFNFLLSKISYYNKVPLCGKSRPTNTHLKGAWEVIVLTTGILAQTWRRQSSLSPSLFADCITCAKSKLLRKRPCFLLIVHMLIKFILTDGYKSSILHSKGPR